MYDFIIVGQGIGGTMVSHFLEKYTSNFLVLDGEKHTASFAAAGIINPVTGRNYVKSWLIDELQPLALKTYEAIGKKLHIDAFQRLNILRTLHNIQEENDWAARLQNNEYSQYLLSQSDVSALVGITDTEQAFGEITNSLQIRLKSIILAYRDYLKERGQYEKHQVNHEDIMMNNDQVTIGPHQAKRVIFCEGYQASKSKLFGNLPFKPAKGTALIIRGTFDLKKNLRDKIYITPIGNNLYWVGSGYQFNIDNTDPDENEIEKLKLQLDKILLQPYEIVDKISGIRPAVKTRKPLIGQHQLFKNIYLMNGLGTKGSSLAPYFANMLVEHIFNESAIIDDVNIKKYDL
jgi:glycine oxidase